MKNSAFFKEIEHVQIPWGNRKIYCPLFYYDMTTLSTQFLASTEKVRRSLPSSRMHPLRVTPRGCVVSISVFEYRDCDIGPYNEVMIAIPIVLDKPSPMFTGILSKPPAATYVYVRHLPVTTEIARAAGVEFAGYPKILGDIAFERDGKKIRCELRENDAHILTLTGKEGPLSSAPRTRLQILNVREGYMLRCESIVSERQSYMGRGAADVQLEFGYHPIAQEVREWQLGRLLSYQYTPQHQLILTPVFESLPV